MAKPSSLATHPDVAIYHRHASAVTSQNVLHDLEAVEGGAEAEGILVGLAAGGAGPGPDHAGGVRAGRVGG